MSQHRQDNPREPYPRIGWVSEVHSDQTRVKVDFHGNTVGQPIWAAIGRSFTKSDIELAIDNQLDCRIDFLAGDLSLPILVDIYSSLLDEELLVFRAKNMVIQGDESLVLRSGDAQVSMTARNGSIKTSAQSINTSAEKLQKIQATKVRLN